MLVKVSNISKPFNVEKLLCFTVGKEEDLFTSKDLSLLSLLVYFLIFDLTRQLRLS